MSLCHRHAASLLILLTALLPACSGPPQGSAAAASPTAAAPSPAATSVAHAIEPTPLNPAKPAVMLPDGTQVSLELAVTPEEHAQGLMFRPDVPESRGMLFLFSEPTYPRFWMKNTWTPLDIVFLDGRGTVLSIVHDAQPCREEPCPEYGPQHAASAVLELRAGTAAKHGLADGSVLRFEHVPEYPSQAAGAA